MANDLPAPQPHHWLGLCLVTESNLPQEWPYIAWVVRNRVESSRYPDTYEGVILQPMQFSAFNPYTSPRKPFKPRTPLDVFRDLMAESLLRDYLLLHAIDVARVAIAQPRDLEKLPADFLHYFSPVSMKPPGSRPAWAASAKQLVTPLDVDPQRFVFARGVP